MVPKDPAETIGLQPPARMTMPRVFTKEDVRAAERLVSEINSEFRGRISAVILDRIPVRPENAVAMKSKIPVVVIIDDLTKPMFDNDVHNYLAALKRFIARISPKLHISTLKLSEHWKYSRMALPQHLDLLRYGVALYDRGFFNPMRMLVTRGRVRPTFEAEGIYITRADATLKNANNHLIQAAVDLYWAAIDASHAALMSRGHMPPEPADVAIELEEKLVQNRLLEREYASMMQLLYELSRGIIHKTVREMSGEDYEHYYSQASKIVKRMERIVVG